MECPKPSCGKKFASKYSLKRHIRITHDHLRPFHCPFCFKSFASKQNQAVHEYMHRSTNVAVLPVPTPSQEPYETAVPKLTDLVAMCRDQDLRPFVTQRKVFFWPVDHTSEVLAPIRVGSMQEGSKCPSFPLKAAMISNH